MVLGLSFSGQRSKRWSAWLQRSDESGCQRRRQSATLINATSELSKTLYTALGSITEGTRREIQDAGNRMAVGGGVKNTIILPARMAFVPVLLPTGAEGDGVDEGARNLLGCSLVPQREVIGVEDALLVLRRQEVSEESRTAAAAAAAAIRLIEHSDSCHADDDDNDTDDDDNDADDERHSLIGELIGRYEELGPGQAGACAQEGDLHPLVWVPDGSKQHFHKSIWASALGFKNEILLQMAYNVHLKWSVNMHWLTLQT